MRRLFGSLLLLLAVALAVSGCAQPTPTPMAKPTQAAAPTALLTAAPTAAPTALPTAAPSQEELSGSITIAGSTSVQPLAEKLAKAFMGLHPKVQIDVQGGGSSVGVKSAGEGTVEIGSASREVKDEEKNQFPDLRVHRICLDVVAVVVNPGVTVDELSKEQVAGIFSGEITNWQEVGGANLPIVVVAREEGSGTRDFFQEYFLGKEKQIVETAILQSSSGALRTAVHETPGAVGFVSLGYVDDSIKAVKLDGVEASAETVYGGTYKVVRPFNLLTKGEPTGAVKAFIDWVVGPEGQALVEKEHYFKLNP